MEINYELTKKDLIDFSNATAKENEGNKTTTQVFTGLALGFIFADFIYVVIRGWEFVGGIEGFILSLFIRFLLAFGVLGLFYYIVLNMQKRIAKNLENIAHNGVFCEHKIVFDENVFTEITDVNTSQHSWISVGEIKEMDDFVSINVNLSGTHFIPKRFFNDEQHIKHFIETAQHYQQSAKEKFNVSHLAEFDRNKNLLKN